MVVFALQPVHNRPINPHQVCHYLLGQRTIISNYTSSFSASMECQHSSFFSYINISRLGVLLLQVLAVQTPGFTAAVRLGAELLKHWNDACTAWWGPVFLSCPCDGKPHIIPDNFRRNSCSVSA